MIKTAVITGITGQDGAYLSNFLLKKKYKIIGIAPSLTKKFLVNLDYFKITKRLILIKGDVTDCRIIKNVLKKYNPDEFYNLAGQSSVGKSWEKPQITLEINGKAVIKILKLIKQYSPQTRFFQCSSAEIYGNSRKAITEKSSNFKPVSPYGKSKLFAHLAVQKFREKEGLFACNGILFNHESPFKNNFAVSKKIVRGVASIVLGSEKKIILGNLNILRDWGYAGDFVKAMWLMLQRKRPSDFVICTGRSYSIKKFVAETFKQAGIKNWHFFVEIDRNLFRKKEVKNMRGFNYKARKSLGWKPKVNFKQLVKLMLDFELKNFKSDNILKIKNK